MKPEKYNFCGCVRNAVIALGCSTVKLMNVINSELGKMKVSKTREDSIGDVKISKATKKKDAASSVTVKPGSVTFTGTANIALAFMAWNDIVAKAEKLMPTMQVQLGDIYIPWVKKVATKDATETTEEEVIVSTDIVEQG